MFPREAELKTDDSQEAAAHSDIVVATLTEELNVLREELDNKIALGKRYGIFLALALYNCILAINLIFFHYITVYSSS